MEEICVEQLNAHVTRCRLILSKGYSNMHSSRLPWLNAFCLEFLKLSEKLHKLILLGNEEQESFKRQDQLEIVYLCLTQIVTCIKHLEKTIKTEETLGMAVSASRQHFLDRIIWCLDRIRNCAKLLESKDGMECNPIQERTFVELMDAAFEQLSTYSSYRNEHSTEEMKETINIAEERARAMFASKQIRSVVDLALSHTLAFANVALEQDKKALSALCQKVLRECIAFQEECAASLQSVATISDSYRKLKAISLENALYQLEDYINEALLRLVYTTFLDFKKLSVNKLREVIKAKDADDPELDELIADFDVNIDRTTQIGMFAIAFAPNVKIKTAVRSCLASFESLDSCIIPSLQSKVNSAAYAQLLEQHFNEEVANFEHAIQEIVDSQAFASCFQEFLNQAINANDKIFNKQSFLDVLEMGCILQEHFKLSVNQNELLKEPNRLEQYNKFTLMLNECRAILKFCETEQVDKMRIIKRFKILRSVLGKLINALSGKNVDDFAQCSDHSQVFIMSDEMSDSQRMFASIGISPSIRSILYDNSPTSEARRRLRLTSDSLKGNCSKFPILSPPVKVNYVQNASSTSKLVRVCNSFSGQEYLTHSRTAPGPQCKPFSLRRKQSLRTTMFKRQKLYSHCESTSSLQISEILDQLSGLSSDFSDSVLDKSIISQ